MKQKNKTVSSAAVHFSETVVGHIAKLVNLTVTEEEKKRFADGFATTIGVVNQLFRVEVGGVSPTHQVTGLVNVFRDDVVSTERMFSQEEALRNAKHTYNGFVVVERILEGGK